MSAATAVAPTIRIRVLTPDRVTVGFRTLAEGEEVAVHPDFAKHAIASGAADAVGLVDNILYAGEIQEATGALRRRQAEDRRTADWIAARETEPEPRVEVRVTLEGDGRITSSRRTYNPGEVVDLHEPRAVEAIAEGFAAPVGPLPPKLAAEVKQARDQREMEAVGAAEFERRLTLGWLRDGLEKLGMVAVARPEPEADPRPAARRNKLVASVPTS